RGGCRCKSSGAELSWIWTSTKEAATATAAAPATAVGSGESQRQQRRYPFPRSQNPLSTHSLGLEGFLTAIPMLCKNQPESPPLPNVSIGYVYQCQRCGNNGHKDQHCVALGRFEDNCAACGEYDHISRTSFTTREPGRVRPHVSGVPEVDWPGKDEEEHMRPVSADGSLLRSVPSSDGRSGGGSMSATFGGFFALHFVCSVAFTALRAHLVHSFSQTSPGCYDLHGRQRC
ncbi:unnamed protein product, partial [Pylaiella littoralis]